MNLAVWSIGSHARKNILPAVIKSKKVNLKGLLTRHTKLGEDLCADYQCVQYPSAEALLQSPDIDIIHICSPNGIHFEQAKACIEHGKHIIVEKRAFSTLEQSYEIANLAKAQKVLVLEAFMYQYHAQFKQLKKLLAVKKYGAIRSIYASFGFPYLPKNSVRHSKKLDGGALGDAGVYPISAILALMGNDVDLVYSTMNFEKDFEVDTSGLAVFKNKGQKGICQWIFGGSYKNAIEIWCENGHIYVDRAFSKTEQFPTSLSIHHNGEIIETINSGEDNHFTNMYDHCYDLINEEQYESSIESLILQSEIVEKIRLKQ